MPICQHMSNSTNLASRLTDKRKETRRARRTSKPHTLASTWHSLKRKRGLYSSNNSFVGYHRALTRVTCPLIGFSRSSRALCACKRERSLVIFAAALPGYVVIPCSVRLVLTTAPGCSSEAPKRHLIAHCRAPSTLPAEAGGSDQRQGLCRRRLNLNLCGPSASWLMYRTRLFLTSVRGGPTFSTCPCRARSGKCRATAPDRADVDQGAQQQCLNHPLCTGRRRAAVDGQLTPAASPGRWASP